MNEKDSIILLKYIFKTKKLVVKGYRGEILVQKINKLTEKLLKKIKDEVIKKSIKKIYEKTTKKYLKDYGYDNLELIKVNKKE